MSSQHPIIAFEVAHVHQDEMLHRAEVHRLTDVAGSDQRQSFGGMKRVVGQALVRMGERLQAKQRRSNGSELAAAAGALRISR